MPVINEILHRRRNSIPVLYTRGTYYEVGYDVGRTFQGLIKDFLASYKDLKGILLPAYETEAGKAAYEATLESLNTNFPHYVRELKGTADGAHVPFLHLMLLHMDQIVPKNAGKTGSHSIFGCSTVYCTNETQVILGHTEDTLEDVLNYIYIVSAHITEETPQGRWRTVEENFTAMCYAGHLPGFCMSYNHHGLAYSINVIFPKSLLVGKTPRHFLARALLSAETEKQAQQILTDRSVGSADGFSVNMIFSKQVEEYLFHNIEVGPANGSQESQMSILTINPGESFFHANSYQRLNIPEDADESSSSIQRLAKAAQSHPVDTFEKIKSLLSDTTDEDFPIFREGGEIDPTITSAVGIFDLLERTWTIWMKNPCESEPVLKLPIIFNQNFKISNNI